MVYVKENYLENNIYKSELYQNKTIHFDIKTIKNDIIGCIPKYPNFIVTLEKFPLDKLFKSELRQIKLDKVWGKYICIDAYKIPENFYEWNFCPNCGLRPLTWEFNNGSSTACGCGESVYDHFSIVAESIMSYVSRNNGSALYYDHKQLKNNWNHWCETGEKLETNETLKSEDKW